jgi:hypothetical protein
MARTEETENRGLAFRLVPGKKLAVNRHQSKSVGHSQTDNRPNLFKRFHFIKITSESVFRRIPPPRVRPFIKGGELYEENSTIHFSCVRLFLFTADQGPS